MFSIRRQGQFLHASALATNCSSPRLELTPLDPTGTMLLAEIFVSIYASIFV